MDLIKTIEDLIKFRTETGNTSEINKACEYIKNKFINTNVYADIFQSDASPVIFLRNTQELNFDVIVLGHIDVVPADDNMFIPKVSLSFFTISFIDIHHRQ